MLRRRGLEAVLIDFGLARELTVPGKLKSSSVFGTECFAPIEQYERRAARGPYTDVYSLAVTLYVMLTGELPCPSRYRKPIDPLTPPKQHKSEISSRVNAAIMKGMELEPPNRPQSVQEWLDLLVPKQVVLPSPKISPQPPQKWLDLPIPKQAAADFNFIDLVMPKQAAVQVNLVSAVGMDYINLRNLLAAKKWQEADEETARVMLKVAGREKERWLDTESIGKFPCKDLRTIDQLWVKYSNGRFGFSVQKRIYQSIGGTREYNKEVWERFGDRVGWRKKNERQYYTDFTWQYYTDLTFSEQAPVAHLPWLGWGRGVPIYAVVGVRERWYLGICILFSRVETCRL